MKPLWKLEKRRDQLKAKIARLSGERPDETTRVAASFHLGTVGGSGRNVAALNRKRDASVERRVNQAVAYCDAVRELAYVESNILYAQTQPARLAARERAEEVLAENGKSAASRLKPGDKVRWIVSGSDCTVVRVNKTSVTVEMCGGHERLKFDEITERVNV